jgi:ankyrin repeat protein
LESLPKTLDETYERILLRISEQNRPKACVILRWLTFSIRPMQLQEIAEATAVEPEYRRLDPDNRLFDSYDILTICSSLISLSDDTTELKLAHQSVKEYLLSERVRAGAASPYFVTEQIAHKSIAEICLTYLLAFERPNPLSADILLDFPLLVYAAKYWYKHAYLVLHENSISSLCLQLLEPVGSLSFLNWLCVFEPDQPWKKPDFQKTLHKLGTPIYYASYCGLLATVQHLCEHGVDVNATDNAGRTPIYGAASNGHELVVDFLLANGADIDGKGDFGRTGLIRAAARGLEKMVQLLLMKGASIEAKEAHGATALVRAAWSGYERVVQLLLNKGACIEATDDFDETALIRASGGGHTSAVRVLLENGANLEARTKTGETALIWAASDGHEAVVRLLLEKSADIEARTNSGKSSLDLAKANKHQMVADLLLKYRDRHQL